MDVFIIKIYFYNILHILLVYHLEKNTNIINYFILYMHMICVFIKATKRHKRSTFVEVSSWIYSYDKVLS